MDQNEIHSQERSALRAKLAIIIISALLLAAAYAVERWLYLPTWQLLLVYLVPYLIAGWGTLREAAEGIAHGDLFNEDFLMAVATIGALAIGFVPSAATEFPEAVFVMLFFQVGELFEEYAEGRSRAGISHLMGIRPDTARVVRGGEELEVASASVGIGETVVVRPGDRIPLDGIISEGESSLNTVALTGESMPRPVAAGDAVASGCVNVGGLLRIRTTKTFGESTASRIISLVESAADRKSRSEAFITRFARIYTPVVVLAAVALAAVPPLFAQGGYMSAFPTWLYRALMFLIVSCPCALVISVPLAFFGGIGGASRSGVLVKGSNFLEQLAHLGIVVFDKTGTLTRGRFAVEAVHPDEIDSRSLLHLAAHVEHYSTHPVAAALRAAFPAADGDCCTVGDVEEISGQGVRAVVNGRTVCVGNTKLMDAAGAKWHDCKLAGTVVHVAINGRYAGHVVISDSVKDDSAAAISRLKELGVSRAVMLTGDGDAVAADVAGRTGVDEWHARLLPADKVAHVERLLAEKREGESLAFVGDGINDAPVLARADVGIAMGALGSDAAIEAADVVLMDDKPSKIAAAVGIARRTLRIARENTAFAIGVKLAVLLLATAGLCTMGLAVFADVGVTVIAVLNAMRALAASGK